VNLALIVLANDYGIGYAGNPFHSTTRLSHTTWPGPCCTV
jgi:hypothetical protein